MRSTEEITQPLFLEENHFVDRGKVCYPQNSCISQKLCTTKTTKVFNGKFALRSPEIQRYSAESFNSWIAERFPFIHKLTLDAKVRAGNDYVVGLESLADKSLQQQFVSGVPCGSPLWRENIHEITVHNMGAKIAFNGVVNILSLERSDGTVVDRIDPMGIASLGAGLRRAKGRVLIYGIKLGLLALETSVRHQVDHIMIMDDSADLIQRFGPNIQEHASCTLSFEVGSLFDPAMHPFIADHDVVLMNCWDKYRQAREDHRLRAVENVCNAHQKLLWSWGDTPYPAPNPESVWKQVERR